MVLLVGCLLLCLGLVCMNSLQFIIVEFLCFTLYFCFAISLCFGAFVFV